MTVGTIGSGDRNSRRLEIARRIARRGPDIDMKAYVKNLTKEKRDRLRSLVDWVESYEATELSGGKSIPAYQQPSA